VWFTLTGYCAVGYSDWHAEGSKVNILCVHRHDVIPGPLRYLCFLDSNGVQSVLYRHICVLPGHAAVVDLLCTHLQSVFCKSHY
jgi:hypothetical protein